MGALFIAHFCEVLVSFLASNLTGEEKAGCFTYIAFSCHVNVSILCLILTVPRVGLRCVLVTLPCHRLTI